MGRQYVWCGRVITLLVTACLLVTVVGFPSAEGSGDLQDVIETVRELDEDQKQIMSELFQLSRQIESKRIRIDQLVAQAAVVSADIERLGVDVDNARYRYEDARDSAVLSLRMLQRLGPTSYLELILRAESVKDLVERIGVALAAARGLTTAVGKLRGEYQELILLVAELERSYEEIEEIRQAEEAALTELELAVTALEDRLVDLGSEREFYESRLAEVELAWADNTRPVVEQLVASFYGLMEENVNIPGMRIGLSLSGLRLLVPIAGLNAIMDQRADLGGATFRVEDQRLWMDLPQALLAISGEFAVDPPSTMVFVVGEVWFMDLIVTDEAVDILFADRELTADVSGALSGYKLRSIKLVGDELEFSIRP